MVADALPSFTLHHTSRQRPSTTRDGMMETGPLEVQVLSCVWAGLWVGPARAINANELSSRGITTLVWATPEIDPPDLPEEVRIVKVLIKDDPDQDISPYFPVVAEAFKECRECGKNGMAMVCRAGVSRSASLALAALVGQTDLGQMTLRHAYLTIKAARPFIRPNYGFFSQLITYEIEIRGRATVLMKDSPFEAGEQLPDVYIEELKQNMGSIFTNFFPF
ncbi:dual specificity protein phosphatase 14 isoform X2 [Procambarus clarkii]|uniref:dual specificity protein phosphatase 14 isoform X2 n=1 Tax=Procambarus clarkii TaxID=6728 RepID=UPI001E67018E|nr:dual specificity protein phosphatase 14-like isoform X1 [Procambarus clarkii]